MLKPRSFIGQKKKSSRLVAGVGFKGTKYSAKIDGKHTEEYRVWRDMLQRCYAETSSGRNKTYKSCTVSENFKSFEYFHEWCQKQIGFGNKDENGRSWCLDKDILLQGNKVYSEDTCVFIPNKINCLFVSCGRVKGKFMAGVFFDDRVNKFISQCSDGNGKSEKLGTFRTELEAFKTYKAFKENRVKRLAEDYKWQIDQRAYQALLSWEVVENIQTVTGE